MPKAAIQEQEADAVSMQPTDPSALRVLVIDDEKNIRATVAMCLEDMGCQVSGAASAAEARAAIADRAFEVAFLDLRLGTDNGPEVLSALLGRCPGLP